jgi:hypothetical protein
MGIQSIEDDLSKHVLQPLLKLRLDEFELHPSMMHSVLAHNVQMLGELLVIANLLNKF